MNGNNLQMLFKTVAGANMGYKVGVTQYQVVDDVQENYVVVVCNDDGEFGKDYRFGFNGQSKDNEIAGIGNHNTALFWEYDTRLGRRWNTDPVVKPWESSYATFSNNSVIYSDVNGDDPFYWLRQALSYSGYNPRAADQEAVARDFIVDGKRTLKDPTHISRRF